MASIKTVNFLPTVFRSAPNRKFLGATLDQLVSEPNFKKINGYIGRRFAPTFKSTDSYLPEPSTDRRHYQLEPSAVVETEDGIQFFSSYSDLLQKISYYGGVINDHSRLFSNEYYSFSGQVDFDKVVNFNQYYWLPNGPKAVDVFSGAVDNEETFTVTRDTTTNSYQFSKFSNSPNPDILLARGGVYQFALNQPGAKFWIQTDPGIDGTRRGQSNISTRTVFGVDNNGSESGIVTFRVPQLDAQDKYVNLQLSMAVDLATDLPFNSIESRLLSTLISEHGGIDGVSSQLSGKYLAFMANDFSDIDWEAHGVFANQGYGISYDAGVSVPDSQRLGIWQIRLDDAGDGGQIIKLSYIQDIQVGTKIFVKSGTTFANKEFYKETNGLLYEVPLITAPLSELYYNDGSDQQYYGRIRIVNDISYSIDVDNEILGKVNYTSPNGVVFTNGLRILFDDQVVPSLYASKEYYVEGVGTSIRLVAVDDLVTPEFDKGVSSVPFDIYSYDADKFDQILNGPLTPDYITINRASIDGNAWSRSNRWFHVDTLYKSAEYNNVVADLSAYTRAQRPIIEFLPDLQLFNNGRVARRPVDLIDFTVTNAMLTVEGSNSPYVGNTKVMQGMRVIFVNDEDPTIRSHVYTINILQVQELDPVNQVMILTSKIHLTAADEPPVEKYDSVVSLGGTNKGIGYWYNGSTWVKAQQKTAVNQNPKFEVMDADGVSFADPTVYKISSFAGTSLFSFTVGKGKADSVLGFPLAYRNFNSVGDIQFTNNFDSDTFTYTSGKTIQTYNVSRGFLVGISSRDTVSPINVWTKCKEPSKQYQNISYVFAGGQQLFYIDILPAEKSTIPYVKVFVNSKPISRADYYIASVGARKGVLITSTLALNDSIDILIYSNQVSALGHYEIPSNLDFNTLNKQFQSLTLGQLRNHLVSMSGNSKIIIGSTPGNSNLRDLDISDVGGCIQQHSAPAIYSSLFLLDKEANFIDGLSFAAKEYTKFKNKFLELYPNAVNAGIKTAAEGVDYIIQSLMTTKNISSPWYYSDMVPYDENKSIIRYTVLDTYITEYEIDSIFDDTRLGNKAILVYLNNQQLVKGVDYTFGKDRPSVKFLTALNYDDVIDIRVYHNTDGNYIPETPTKLGLYPKYRPEIIYDDTYSKPITVIRGHDGSLTPTFGDFRDALLLELERRIYNNIKIEYDPQNFDINSVIPGKFRNSDYTRSEFSSILTQSFLTWVSDNRLDYSENKWFMSNNPWTWTYSDFKDPVFDEFLPGYWRGIYNHFYDTDAPHTRPWEMLGFSEQPDWWTDVYGPAPYTGGNLVLWGDLEAGRIAAGPRAGIDLTYARLGLSTLIPVDDTGELRSPDRFAVKSFSSTDANGTFVIGDDAPVEAAWKRSSDYPFAVQRAIALAKPAEYFGQLATVQYYKRDSKVNQFLTTDTHRRITPSDFLINGDSTSGTIVRSAGYLNWVVDYLTSMSVNPVVKLRSYLDNLDVRLGYRVAGFTDKSYLSVLAEQNSPNSVNESVVVPNESYSVYLHKSTPVSRAIYSAVIVEKTSGGYSVIGYNQENPYFTIIPSEQNSNRRAIVAAGASGIVYNDYRRVKMSVPYGYEFSTRQQLVDFLISYGRYLQSQGFLFEAFNQSLQTQQNWELAATEFLTWCQQGWSVGSVLVLSPTLNSVSIVTTDAVVDEINNLPTGSKVLDVNFKVVNSSAFSAVRESNTFSLTVPPTMTLGLVDLSLVQYEHVLVFNNETIFNDVIYKPELGNRQYRLRLVGNKTGDWDGQVSPPGFVYSSQSVSEWKQWTDYRKGELVSYKTRYYVALQPISASSDFVVGLWKQVDKSTLNTGLLPNFAYNAKKFELMYDVDSPLYDQNINAFGSGLLGFRDRGYLTDLGVNAESQVKFYQGYIRDKGTKDAVTALANATFNNMSGNIDFYEEWAFRVGEYGATNSNQFLEVLLDDSTFTTDPASFTLLNTGETAEANSIVGVYKEMLYKKPLRFTDSIFKNRDSTSNTENDIQTAGYVNLADIDATIYNMSDYVELSKSLKNVIAGYSIWVANDHAGNWNVYRVNETEVHIVSLEYQLDNFASITSDIPHGLSSNDIFVVKGFDSSVDGFYKVSSVTDLYTVFVTIPDTLKTALIATPTISSDGLMYTLHSLRFSQIDDALGFTPAHGWRKDDKIWVDTDSVTGDWAVYQKNEPWSNSLDIKLLKPSDYVSDSGFGRVLAMRDDAQILVVGIPNRAHATGTGEVQIFIRLSNGKYINSDTLTSVSTSSKHYGSTVDIANNTIVVGAPGSSEVFIYEISPAGYVTFSQIIQGPIGTEFGSSVALSGDSQWLYVGAPGSNSVFAYELSTVTRDSTIITTDGIAHEYALPFTDLTIESIIVRSSLRVFVPDVDYTIVGNTLHFTVVPIVDQFSVIYRTYYGHRDTIISPVTGNTRFGSVVKTQNDGSLITISAPTQVTGGVASGSVYVVDRYNSNFDVIQELKAPERTTLDGFGESLAVIHSDSTLFVGSPKYRNATVEGGAVIRYAVSTLDRSIESKTFNSVADAIVTAAGLGSGSIRINGILVPLSGSLTTVSDQINKAKIDSVTASIVPVPSGYQIVISSKVGFTLLPGDDGYAGWYSALGFEYYSTAQVIANPFVESDESFGYAVAVDQSSRTLLISGIRADIVGYQTYDAEETIFDGNSTQYYDVTVDSGAVFAYNELSVASKSDYAFTQQLRGTAVKTGDMFGSAVAIAKNVAIVGSERSTQSVAQIDEQVVLVPHSGTIYEFTNVDNTPSWQKIRESSTKVELSNITKLFVYNRQTQVILSYLDYIDPSKGKMLGIVEQEIAYKTSFDPANYNVGTRKNAAVDDSFHWGNTQVGRLWWDLSKVKYIDYEQGGLVYRIANWGKLFPGSTITVAEWVKSEFLPSAYNGNGTPLYADDSAYVVDAYVDSITGEVRSEYYYWVTNKTDVPLLPFRQLSTNSIADAIINPEKQGIPYAMIVRDDSISLVNVTDYISADKSVLHVDYTISETKGLIHNEYELVREKDASAIIPDRIMNKLIDSLTGLDANGNQVPDITLSAAEKYGIGLRPRQTMIVNRLSAVKNLVRYVNQVLAKNQIVGNYNLNQLFTADPEPTTGWDIRVENLTERDYLPKSVIVPDTDTSANKKVLVANDSTVDNQWAIYEVTRDKEYSLLRTQAFNTFDYWDYADWYAADYDPTIKPTYTIEYERDIATVPVKSGTVVKIKNHGPNRFIIRRYTSTAAYDIVGLQGGTIQLNAALYAIDTDRIGFSNDSFDMERFDLNPSIEFRHILYALRDNIFINDLRAEMNNLFFMLLNYIMSEQRSVDWAFKTSFVSIIHRLRKLEQFPNYVKDNQEYYESYIDEVKPYRTKIREYIADYQGDEVAAIQATDFDLPSYYDTDYGQWRSPNGDHARDAVLLSTDPKYAAWNANHTYTVAKIVVENPGYGYTQDPAVVISGGGGTGATAKAVIDYYSGSLTKVIVTNAGVGYTSTPTVKIFGDGSDATAYPMLENKSVRQFNTTLKFDRVTYSSDVTKWKKNSTYATGDIVSYDAELYQVNRDGNPESYFEYANYNKLLYSGSAAEWKTGATYSKDDIVFYDNEVYRVNQDIESGPYFEYSNYTKIFEQGTNIILNYNDKAYLVNQIGNTGSYYEYTDYINLPYSLPVTEWRQNTTFTEGNIVSYGSDVYVVNKASNPESYFEYANYTKFDASELPSAMDRVNAFYSPTTGMTPNDLRQLFTGVEYPGVSVDGPRFEDGPGFDQSPDILVWPTSEVTLDWSVNPDYQWPYLSVSKKIRSAYATADGDAGAEFSLAEANHENLLPYGLRGTTYPVGQFVYVTSTNTYYEIIKELKIESLDLPLDKLSEITNTATRRWLSGGYDVSPFDNFEYNSDGTVQISSDQIDTILTGSYLDNDLAIGKSPEDILKIGKGVADGGGYMDRFNSHAPEELLPGIMFDNLSIKVYTIDPNPNSIRPPIGFRISKPMNSRSLNTVYTMNKPLSKLIPTTLIGNLSADATTIPLSTVEGLADPVSISRELIRLGYSVDRPISPCTIVINNETISYTGIDTATSSLTGVTRGVLSTTAKYHTAGSQIRVYSEKFEYHRLAAANTTELAIDLHITDSTITVVDASKLPVPGPRKGHPGVVYINGEKITYYTIDTESNTLGQIRRGVHGTGAATVHPAGSRVEDASSNQLIPTDPTKPGNVGTQIWMNPGVGEWTDGQGLMTSNTVQALFLKASPASLPQ